MKTKIFVKKSGGKCCKKSGCDYIPKDFDSLDFKDIYNKLKSGNISIVAMLRFEKFKNGKIIIDPLLYLRARNINREVVDLLSFKTQCSMLTKSGCSYSYNQRPSGGINLVPEENGMCHPLNDSLEMMMQWEKYQKVLGKCVEEFTGHSVNEQLKIDVEKLFKDIYNENYKNVSITELEDVRKMIPLLIETFPSELQKVKKLSLIIPKK